MAKRKKGSGPVAAQTALALNGFPVRRLRVADLVAAPYNPRTISDRALEGLGASVKEYGLVQPCVVNRRTGHLVGGHQRVRGLAGTDEIDVIEVDLDEVHEKALNVALNSPAIGGEFTADLAPLLEEIRLAEPVLYADIQFAELAPPEAGAPWTLDAIGDGGPIPSPGGAEEPKVTFAFADRAEYDVVTRAIVLRGKDAVQALLVAACRS